MSKYIIFIIPFLIHIFGTKEAKAADETKEFYVKGLKVIFKPSPKEIISARLFIDGGTANYQKDQEGIESLALQMAVEGGTDSLSKIAFNSEAEKVGAHFSSSTTYDYGNMDMTCIKMFWDKSWALFVDAILHPAFDAKEFGIFQEQAIAGAKHMQADPDAHLRNIAMAHVFKGKDYAKIPTGTPESLGKLTDEDVKNYYNSVVSKKRCFLVVVGKVDEQDLKDKIAATLASLPEGTAAQKEPRYWIKKGSVFIEDRDIATNYIRGIMSAPRMNTDDGIPMRLAMAILQDKFFVELRTKRSLSYAPAAFYSTGVLNNPYNVIYISTLDPAQSMQVMVDVINKIKKEGFQESDLKNQQQSFLTHYYMGLETSASQSNALGMAEIAGDWKIADTFTQKVNATTLKDINHVFDKYTNYIQWTYLGKKDAVKEDDFKQVKPSKKNRPY